MRGNFNIRVFPEYWLMVGQTNSGAITDSLDIRALDQLFEVDLKPLKNTNARILYKIFLDSKKSKHLTTLDIQDKLKSTDLMLQKKEINAWLSSLQSAGLITKENMRGKPTTIEYLGRYTYDLWKLTEKGRDIANKLEIFSSGKTSLKGLDNAQTDADFGQNGVKSYADSNNHTDPNIMALLRVILHTKDSITLEDLRERMSPSAESLLETISRGNLEGVLIVRPEESTSIAEKIFGFLGMPKKRKYRLTITDEGREILTSADAQSNGAFQPALD